MIFTKEMMIGSPNSISTIYLVSYKEVYQRPELGRVKNTTYNLHAFETLNMAKDYLDCACECLLAPNIKSGNFRVILRKDVEKESGNIIVERTIRLMGNNDHHKSHTKLFVFTIEAINFKSPIGK